MRLLRVARIGREVIHHVPIVGSAQAEARGGALGAQLRILDVPCANRQRVRRLDDQPLLIRAEHAQLATLAVAQPDLLGCHRHNAVRQLDQKHRAAHRPDHHTATLALRNGHLGARIKHVDLRILNAFCLEVDRTRIRLPLRVARAGRLQIRHIAHGRVLNLLARPCALPTQLKRRRLLRRRTVV